jgi:hypothetical protein
MGDEQTVEQALKEYYETHYFGDAAMRDPIVWVNLGPLKFPMPNPKQRREVIYLHDLTHLTTGYDTSWAGEGEVAAYELASGFPAKHWIGYFYSPLAFFMGAITAPLRLIRAFRRGWRAPNLYKLDLPREKILKMTLGELKQLIKLA